MLLDEFWSVEDRVPDVDCPVLLVKNGTAMLAVPKLADGKISACSYLCSSCGAIMGSSISVCPDCGYENYEDIHPLFWVVCTKLFSVCSGSSKSTFEPSFGMEDTILLPARVEDLYLPLSDIEYVPLQTIGQLSEGTSLLVLDWTAMLIPSHFISQSKKYCGYGTAVPSVSLLSFVEISDLYHQIKESKDADTAGSSF